MRIFRSSARDTSAAHLESGWRRACKEQRRGSHRDICTQYSKTSGAILNLLDEIATRMSLSLLAHCASTRNAAAHRDGPEGCGKCVKSFDRSKNKLYFRLLPAQVVGARPTPSNAL